MIFSRVWNKRKAQDMTKDSRARIFHQQFKEIDRSIKENIRFGNYAMVYKFESTIESSQKEAILQHYKNLGFSIRPVTAYPDFIEFSWE